MLAPEIPPNEAERQTAVERYDILDTPAEQDYDDITALMSFISGAPISLITLLDNNRNWIKSHHGVELTESPRELSFCGHVINADSQITIVEDARKDKRFCDNPLVVDHSAIFYAGVPLRSNDGFKLGTLCVFDQKPRELNESTKAALSTMARQVEILLDHRLQKALLKSAHEKLVQHNLQLTRFAHAVRYNLNSASTGVLPLIEPLLSNLANGVSTENADRLKQIKKSTLSISDYVDDLLV